MINTGQYIIYYYNNKGSKLKDIAETCNKLTDARELAEETLESSEDLWYNAVSYTIDRRLINSLDEESLWK